MSSIIRVNVGDGSVSSEEAPEAYALLGGRALTSRIVLDEVDATAEPLGPANKLVFAPGLLGGTAATTSGRTSFGGKSPLMNGCKEANVGGTLGHRLSKLGVKAVVIEGVAGQSLFFLAHGQAKVTKAWRLLNLLNAGECFGEMAYVKAGALPRQATVESMSDTVLAEFEAQALEKTSLNCRLQLANALLHSMVDRLALANERMARAAQ